MIYLNTNHLHLLLHHHTFKDLILQLSPASAILPGYDRSTGTGPEPWARLGAGHDNTGEAVGGGRPGGGVAGADLQPGEVGGAGDVPGAGGGVGDADGGEGLQAQGGGVCRGRGQLSSSARSSGRRTSSPWRWRWTTWSEGRRKM